MSDEQQDPVEVARAGWRASRTIPIFLCLLLCAGAQLALGQQVADSAAALSQLATAALEEGSPGAVERSLDLWTQAGALYRAAEGQALQYAGLAYMHVRNMDRALACLNDALAVQQKFGDRKGQARALLYLGGVYVNGLVQEDSTVNLAHRDSAIAYLSQSESLSRELGDHESAENALGVIRFVNRPMEALQAKQDSR